MGTHISKVKSVSLDKWTPEQVEVIFFFFHCFLLPSVKLTFQLSLCRQWAMVNQMPLMRLMFQDTTEVTLGAITCKYLHTVIYTFSLYFLFQSFYMQIIICHLLLNIYVFILIL